MAVNKSNKPVNSISSFEEKRIDRLPEYTMEQHRIEEALKREESKYTDIESAYKTATDAQARASLYAKALQQAESVSLAQERLVKYEERHAQTVNTQIANEISTYSKYENVNARTTTMSGSQRYLSQIYKNREMLQIPTEVIERRIQERQQQVSSLGSSIASKTRDLGYGYWENNPDIMGAATNVDQLQEQIALEKRLLKVQSKEGMTTEKRQYAARDELSRVGSLIGAQNIRERVISGEHEGFSKEFNRLKQMFGELTSAMEEFASASENATDANGKLTDQYTKASEKLEKAKQNIEEQRKLVAGIGQYGGGGGAGGWGTALSVAKPIINTAIGIGIDDSISEMGTRAAFANRAVAQYERGRSAIHGDMGALLREVTAQDFVSRYSSALKGRAEIGAGLGIAASGADTIVGGLADFGNAGGLTVNTGKTIGQGATNLAIGASGTVRQLTQAMRGLPGGRSALMSAEAAEQLALSLQAVNTTTVQSFYDQTIGARNASIGLGGRSISEQMAMTNAAYLNRASMAGLSGTDAIRLMGMAGAVTGGNGAQSASDLAIRASQIEMGRLLTKEQYVSGVGAMTGIGGSAQDLEEIMKRAIENGMGNAKNINQMVEAVQSMSSGLAKIGVSGGTDTANLLSGSIKSLLGARVDPNIATATAMNSLQFQNTAYTDLSLDLGNIYERGELRRLFKGGTVAQYSALQSLGTADFAKLLGAGGLEFAEQIGIKNLVVNKKGDIDRERVMQADAANMMNLMMKMGGDVGAISAKDREAYIRSGGKIMSSDIKAALFQVGVRGEGFQFAGSQNKLDTVIPTEGEKHTDAILKSQAAERNRNIIQGAQALPIEQLTQAIIALTEIMDPEKSKERIKEAASSFSEPQSLTKAGGDLSNAARQLKEAATAIKGSFEKDLRSSGEWYHATPETDPKRKHIKHR